MVDYNADSFRLVPTYFAAALLLTLAAGCASRQAPELVGAEPSPQPSYIAPQSPESQALASDAEASAAPLSLRVDAPLRYVVKRGDTLWGLARFYLLDAWQWPELWYGNGQVKNPHLIYPGDVLRLVTVNGRTQLNIERLSPRIRDETLDQALQAIPIDAIRVFLRGPRLVTLEEAKRAPYVLAFADEHLAVGANSDIYVKNLPAAQGLAYAVVQIGAAYRDPDTRELLGYEAIPAGEAELRTPGSSALMRVTQSSREVLIADRLLPIEAETFHADFYPHAPAFPVDGRIISVFDGLSQIAQYQIVALNRGSDQGIDPGTVLDINQSGRIAPDPYGKRGVLLPDQYAGVLMVFKVTPRLSYALVMSSTRPVHVLDKIKNPAAVGS